MKRHAPMIVIVILTALAAVFAFIPLTLSVFWSSMAYTLIGGTSRPGPPSVISRIGTRTPPEPSTNTFRELGKASVKADIGRIYREFGNWVIGYSGNWKSSEPAHPRTRSTKHFR